MSYPHRIVPYDPNVDLEMLNNRIHRLEDGERLLIDGLPDEMYRAAVGFSTSELKHAELSPAHWLAYKNKKRETKNAFEFGKAVHMAILEPMRLQNDLLVKPAGELRSNAGKQAYINWMYEVMTKRGDTEILEDYKEWYEDKKRTLSEQYKKMEEMIPVTFISEYEKSQCDHILAKVTKFCEQQKVSWTNTEISGWIRIGDQILKGRADGLNTDTLTIDDIKTTRSIEQHSFIYDARKLKYNRSAFTYLLIFDCHLFRWIAVEKEYPYAIGPFQAFRDIDWIQEGKDIITKTMVNLQHSIDSNNYSEPYDSFVTIEPKSYNVEQPEKFVSPFD